MKQKSPFLIAITITLFGSLMFIPSCGGGDSTNEEQAPAAKKFEKITNIETLEVKPRTFKASTDIVGKAEPWKKITLSSEIGGKVEWLGIEEGDKKSKGQLLSKVNARFLYAQRQQAQASHRLNTLQEKWQRQSQSTQVALAENNYQTGMVDYKRQQQLYAEQVVSEKNRDDMASRFNSAKINLDAAQIAYQSTVELTRAQTAASAANLRVARLSYEKSLINAPLTGIIDKVYIEAGQFIGPGTPIADIMQIDHLKITAGVPERDISFIKEGQDVELSFDAYSKETFKGNLYYIGASADNANKTFPIKIKIPNSDKKLRPGMLGRISLGRESYDNQIVIPQDAVIDRVGERVVFIEQNNKAVALRVKVGGTSGKYVRILKGLKVGDKLIVVGHRDVSDQDKVNVIKRRKMVL